jgi:hypothetical protein
MPGRERTSEENARDARRKRRTDAAIVREDHIMQLYAGGLGWDEMSRAMRIEFGGSFAVTTLRRMLERGLARRAAQAPEGVKIVREMLTQKIERLITAHMPLALGDSTGVPDVRSADLVLKAIAQWARISGVEQAPPMQIQEGPTNNINFVLPDNAENARQRILDSLLTEAEKHKIVDGHLAAVGTGLAELTQAHEETDTMAPPPGVVVEEREAA